MSQELMKSKFCLSSVVNTFVVRLWHRLFLNLLHAFLSNSRCCLPFTIRQDPPYTSENFQKLLLLQILAKRFSSFPWMLTWGPVRVEISKCYSYKSQPKVFKLLLNFLLNGPPKISFEIFEVLKIEILTFFFSIWFTWE